MHRIIISIFFSILLIIYLLCFVIHSFRINHTNSKLIHIPIVAIILPVTSKGNNIDLNNPNPSQLLLMKYFYPSFISTIEPSKYLYRIYLGYAYDDPYFTNSIFISKLKKKMYKVKVYYVIHIFTRLVDMYNTLARKAYDDGADYFITLNDDAIINTKKWTSKMVNLLNTKLITYNFGTTGFVSVNKTNFIQFNFVSRLHLDIFNQTFYTPVFYI